MPQMVEFTLAPIRPLGLRRPINWLTCPPRFTSNVQRARKASRARILELQIRCSRIRLAAQIVARTRRAVVGCDEAGERPSRSNQVADAPGSGEVTARRTLADEIARGIIERSAEAGEAERARRNASASPGAQTISAFSRHQRSSTRRSRGPATAAMATFDCARR